MTESPNFLGLRSGAAARMSSHSLARSLREGDLHASTFQSDGSSLIPLWWGVMSEVSPGDTLRWFETPAGIAVEAVEPFQGFEAEPAPMP